MCAYDEDDKKKKKNLIKSSTNFFKKNNLPDEQSEFRVAKISEIKRQRSVSDPHTVFVAQHFDHPVYGYIYIYM